MYEKDETDFSIDYDEKRKNFSLWVGTWHNSNQNLSDVIFYLSLNRLIENKENFYKKLNEFNHLFINNKNDIIKDIETNGLNLLNSCINEYELNDYLNELEYNEKKEKYLTENQYYEIDYIKLDLIIEKEYKKDIIKIIKNSENIITLYNDLQELKETIKNNTYENIFDYIEIKEN
jgi:hypothetical protein